ncbi:MAG: hypothetical protein ACH346_05515 [Chthoniobacterales bacterium]
MKISFCLPEEYCPSAAWREAWNEEKVVPLEESGRIATSQSWIYQTWALLRTIGVPCSLFPQMPQDGIVIVLSGSLSKFCNPPKNVFLVDIVADGLPNPSAHFHIVQNRAHAKRLHRSCFIPHWPQPNLIKRHPERGDHFENISFFGHSPNLASELQSFKWQNRLREELNIQLQIKGSSSWHDYSDTDCVIAIRDFSRSGHFHKPATKLYNAWNAGAPFIGGSDSAYAADGEPGKNYLVASSPEEVFLHLTHLKKNPTFRANLVTEGKKAGINFIQAATLERWRNLIEETLPQLATEWLSMSAGKRRMMKVTQRAYCWMDRYWR